MATTPYHQHEPALASVSSGFTLVELLVAIAIIGVLLALLLPGVQTARDSAHRMACANQLRQIALAESRHADVFGAIPHNGSWDGKQTTPSASGAPFTPATTDFAVGKTFQWGVGEARAVPLKQPGFWLFSLLPYVEQQNAYQNRSWSTPVAIYVCPARRRSQAHGVVRQDAYGSYVGGDLAWCKTDFAGNALVMPGRPGKRPQKCWRLAEVTDGASGTILSGEKAFDPIVQTSATWYWDEPFFLGGSSGTVRDGLGLVADGRGADFKNNWGSPHRGAVQFAFCDGSVRPLCSRPPGMSHVRPPECERALPRGIRVLKRHNPRGPTCFAVDRPGVQRSALPPR